MEPDLASFLNDRIIPVSLLQYANINPRAKMAISAALKLEPKPAVAETWAKATGIQNI